MHQHKHQRNYDHRRPVHSRRNFLSSLVSTAFLAPCVLGQERPQTPSETAELYRKISEQYESDGLTPFKGITTNGEVLRGLFEIKPTGVSTEPVRNAAERFIATLAPVQLARTMYPVDDRPTGSLFCGADRGAAQRSIRIDAGIAQRQRFELTRNIMRLNETLAELAGDHDFLGEWLYFIQIYGKPSATEPWGWKLEGHHAIVNCFVLGDQVVMTPFFVGSEPVRATSGKYKGIEILQQEQNDGLRLLNSFSPEQRKQAILNFSKTGNNNLTEAFKDNVVIDYAGLRTTDLAAPVRQSFRDLIHLYVSNMDEGHKRVKMDEVDRHLDNTWLAWIGGAQPDSTFYYRVHSPVILIEFDHQRPANLSGFADDPRKPTQQHIHCVVRTPNGNDYGKDLLRQHYLAHSHSG